MNSRYRANSAQSLPTVSGSVPRPHVKMGGRPVSHATSASSVALSYRANYQPYGSRADRQSGVRCNAESDCIRILIVVAYFVTVTFGAGFLTFFYASLWIPNVSQIFLNGTYGNERMAMANESLSTPNPTLDMSWNGSTIDPSLSGSWKYELRRTMLLT